MPLEIGPFQPHQRPQRAGVYRALHPRSNVIGYAHHNGRFWGLWCHTREAAETTAAVRSSFDEQGMLWWALTRQACGHEMTGQAIDRAALQDAERIAAGGALMAVV